MIIRIQGEKWKVRLEPVPEKLSKGDELDGICHYGQQTIFVKPDSNDLMRSVLLHELLHARFPDLSEEAVTDFEILYFDALKKTKL